MAVLCCPVYCGGGVVAWDDVEKDCVISEVTDCVVMRCCRVGCPVCCDFVDCVGLRW